LDTWRRSGLPDGDFAALVGLDVPDIAKGLAPKPFRENVPLLDMGQFSP
jgi:hypothetical protein